MPRWDDQENERASYSAADIRGETHVPTPKCSAPRRWRKMRSGRAAATRRCQHAPIARAKDTAAGILHRALSALPKIAVRRSENYSTLRPGFPFAQAGLPGPA